MGIEGSSIIFSSGFPDASSKMQFQRELVQSRRTALQKTNAYRRKKDNRGILMFHLK